MGGTPVPLNDAAKIADLTLENKALKDAIQHIHSTAQQQVMDLQLKMIDDVADSLWAYLHGSNTDKSVVRLFKENKRKELRERWAVALTLVGGTELDQPIKTREDELETQTRDLAMLIKRLVRRIRKCGGPADIAACDKATDYLVRSDLFGSLLRKAESEP